MVKVCVITVAAGRRSGLIETVASVDQQQVAPFLHVLVLNGVPVSEIDRLPRRPYRILVVDQDTSLYNAMNLGLAKAAGDLIVFLNAGDTLYRPSSLATVGRKWDGRSILTGRSLQVFGGTMYLRPAVGRLDELYRSAPHQAFYCPLSETLPLYEETGRIGSDSHWMHAVRQMFAQQCISDILCRFELGGVSNAPSVQTVRRRFAHDGVRTSVKEVVKLLLHRAVGPAQAYRLLYKERYAVCTNRSHRAYQFPAADSAASEHG